MLINNISIAERNYVYYKLENNRSQVRDQILGIIRGVFWGIAISGYVNLKLNSEIFHSLSISSPCDSGLIVEHFTRSLSLLMGCGSRHNSQYF